MADDLLARGMAVTKQLWGERAGGQEQCVEAGWCVQPILRGSRPYGVTRVRTSSKDTGERLRPCLGMLRECVASVGGGWRG